jgi:hypothetical protein
MKKYLSICILLLVFASFAMAQLTLKKLESSQKVSLSIGSLIEIKLPTYTSRPECNCFVAYKGYLKQIDGDSATVVLTEMSRETVDDNKAAIQEKRLFQPANEATISRIPLSKVLAVNKYSESNIGLRNVGAVIFTISAMSNLFLSPAIGGTFSKTLRNFGYGGMALGISTLLLPTKKTYYFEQPNKMKKKKTLWKLGN